MQAPNRPKARAKRSDPFSPNRQLLIPASKLAGIRYSLSESDLLEETLYQVWEESGQKLQKQEVARLALRVLLEDQGPSAKMHPLALHPGQDRPNKPTGSDSRTTGAQPTRDWR